MGHLVISRRPREWLDLCLPDGLHITVTVLRHRGDVVSLGVQAPDRVKIWRGELLHPSPHRAGTFNESTRTH